VRLSDFAGNCRGVRCVDWWVKDMVIDPDAVARDTIEAARRILAETRAEAIVMGCTIVAACYQRYVMRNNAAPELVILNPNLMALKMAESLADLKRQGLYTLARSGFYEKPKGHYREQFLQQRRQMAQALGLAPSSLPT
jgi:allantoin racemase